VLHLRILGLVVQGGGSVGEIGHDVRLAHGH
jgi:hypothetical protein